MSKKAGVEEGEDEDVEAFHDSLDRLLSSSNTSCSRSCASSSSSGEEEEEEDDDDDDEKDPILNSGSSDPEREPIPVPKFPKGVSENYDVWMCQPFSSVEERRFRLLRQMGLSRDPSLFRHRSSLSFSFHSSDSLCRPEGFSRSVSSDRLKIQSVSETRKTTYIKNDSKINRKKDNAIICDNDNNGVHGMFRSKLDGQCKSPSYRHSVNSVLRSPVYNGGGSTVVNNLKICSQNYVDVDKSWGGSGSLNKPPRGRFGSDSEPNGSCNGMIFVGRGDGEGEGNEAKEGDDPVCLIKDLDNGKEFVVNEVREDGMWDKLKEVGTGRQLTMEEFEMCVGTSPIVQELMRRQNVEEANRCSTDSNADENGGGSGSKLKKKGSWLKSIRRVASSVTGYKQRRSSDERDTSSEKGGRRSSSATDGSQDASFHGAERVRVRQYRKSLKELTALYKSQEIQAHNGSIWTIKFSLDGEYLASAGEDCIIHVWQVVESERKGDLLFDKPEHGNLNLLLLANGSPEPTLLSPSFDSHPEKRRKGRSSISRKSVSLEQIMVPETVFALSDKPLCSFEGHSDDVLDLSWSKSQHLLSSSMDKTVRLWHLSSKTCLKIFSHSDYVTCIQFNPVDDRYFISGSLDAKVRIWSIPDRHVVDWNDLHEMVTAACYTPDGQGALVGSYKGSCRLYNTSENKLQQKGQINLQNKKKKSHQKKITGFEFVPGSASEVLITSADSRVWVVDGVDLVRKFKGFRNTNSQISASLTANGKYVVCASEDSNVYVWKHEDGSRPSRSKGFTVTRSYEHFHCQDVSVAIPWPGISDSCGVQDTFSTDQSASVDRLVDVSTANHPPTPVEESYNSETSPLTSASSNSPLHGTITSASNSYFFDRISATWPEEKLVLATEKNCSPQVSVGFSNGFSQSKSAWSMVIITAGLRGEIRTFQNFGLPVRI